MFCFISGWCYLLVKLVASTRRIRIIVTSAKQVFYLFGLANDPHLWSRQSTCAVKSVNTAASYLHDEQNKGFKTGKARQGVQQRQDYCSSTGPER